jgi:hypothetical protein
MSTFARERSSVVHLSTSCCNRVDFNVVRMSSCTSASGGTASPRWRRCFPAITIPPLPPLILQFSMDSAPKLVAWMPLFSAVSVMFRPRIVTLSLDPAVTLMPFPLDAVSAAWRRQSSQRTSLGNEWARIFKQVHAAPRRIASNSRRAPRIWFQLGTVWSTKLQSGI